MGWEECAEFALGAQCERDARDVLEASLAGVFEAFEGHNRETGLPREVNLPNAESESSFLRPASDRFAQVPW